MAGENSEVEELIRKLKSSFIDSIDEIESSTDVRLLTLFDIWKQVTVRRIVDVAEAAESFYTNNRLLSACILTRSTVETVAIREFRGQATQLTR